MEYPNTGGWGWLWTSTPTPSSNNNNGVVPVFQMDQTKNVTMMMEQQKAKTLPSSQVISIPNISYNYEASTSKGTTVVKQEVTSKNYSKKTVKTEREMELDKKKEENRLREQRRRELMTPEEKAKQREQNRERAKKRRLEEKKTSTMVDRLYSDFYGLNEDELRRLEREREVRRVGEKRRRARKTPEEWEDAKERHRVQERERRKNMSELEKEELRMRNRERAKQRREQMTLEEREKWKEKRKLQERKRRGAAAAASSC